MNNPLLDVEQIKKYLDTILQIESKYAHIIIGYPTDLLKLNMKDFDSETYFISDCNCEKGKLIVINDEELKYQLYKFCKENEDRCFRGCKNDN